MDYTLLVTTSLAHLGSDLGAHHGPVHLLWIVGAVAAAVVLGLALRRLDSRRA